MEGYTLAEYTQDFVEIVIPRKGLGEMLKSKAKCLEVTKCLSEGCS